MSDYRVTLTVDEKEYLEDLLDVTLNEARVEEHRTRTPSYREHILKNEKIIMDLQSKLQGAGGN